MIARGILYTYRRILTDFLTVTADADNSVIMEQDQPSPLYFELLGV